MVFFGIGNLEHTPPPKEMGFGGSGGVGGAFLALFRTFLAPFFNCSSDKTVHTIQNVGKGPISLPWTKGFDVAF